MQSILCQIDMAKLALENREDFRGIPDFDHNSFPQIRGKSLVFVEMGVDEPKLTIGVQVSRVLLSPTV